MADPMPPAPGRGNPLAYAHFGHLPRTGARARTYRDRLAALAQLEAKEAGLLGFVYLPGDVADNDLPGQYRLAAALRLASVPAYATSGNHDTEQGGPGNFYTLPCARTVRGVRYLLLGVCNSHPGGPDCHSGAAQLAWLCPQLREVPFTGEARDATGRPDRQQQQLALASS